MKRLSPARSALLAAALFLALALACPPARADQPLRLGGSPFASVLLARLASAFDPDCGPRRITLEGDGPEKALQGLASGQLDAAVLTFDPTPAQLALLGGKAGQLRLTPVAADAVVLIVHPDNRVSDLRLADLRLMLLDKLGNWKLVGGRDLPLVVLSRDASSAIVDALRHRLLDGAPIRPDAIIQGSSDGVLRVVERYEPTIGFVFASELRPGVKPLAIDGVPPTADAAASGAYPLSRTVLLAHLGEPSPTLAAFLDFLRTPQAHDILRQTGFAPTR